MGVPPHPLDYLEGVDRKLKSNQVSALVCRNCGSQNVRVIRNLEQKRKNKSIMQEYRCRDCNTVWQS